MMLADALLLHHGSYAAIDRIDLSKCARGKDFGQGFYLTSDFDQARRFAPSSLRKAQAQRLAPMEQHHGYVTTFRFHLPPDPISVFTFEKADESWLRFIAANRRPAMAKNLLEDIDAAILSADVIVGKVANDATNPTITAYLSGIFGPLDDEGAVAMAVRRLLPNRLTDQFCFLTQPAVDCLEKVEVTRLDI